MFGENYGVMPISDELLHFSVHTSRRIARKIIGMLAILHQRFIDVINLAKCDGCKRQHMVVHSVKIERHLQNPSHRCIENG